MERHRRPALHGSLQNAPGSRSCAQKAAPSSRPRACRASHRPPWRYDQRSRPALAPECKSPQHVPIWAALPAGGLLRQDCTLIVTSSFNELDHVRCIDAAAGSSLNGDLLGCTCQTCARVPLPMSRPCGEFAWRGACAAAAQFAMQGPREVPRSLRWACRCCCWARIPLSKGSWQQPPSLPLHGTASSAIWRCPICQA